MKWDLFCRVIDNWGDIGVCWRLAADLGARGETVSLWCDDASALAWMAPQGAPGVTVHGWNEACAAVVPGDVVIEAFGCELPEPFVAAMAARLPVWINLEYLSAEPYVERSHGLPSPQRNGLTKWFFYPGFTERTGGLLREPGLIERRAGFDARAWLASRSVELAPGERAVSLFCYPGAPVDDLTASLAARPTVVLAAHGVVVAPRDGVRVVPLPPLPQPEFDHLLWSCELNVVRGEDSPVRAIWAGAPFLWQLYPQSDRAHAAKLDAFVDLVGADAAARACLRRWNGLGPGPLDAPIRPGPCRDALLARPDLVSNLLGFVAAKR